MKPAIKELQNQKNMLLIIKGKNYNRSLHKFMKSLKNEELIYISISKGTKAILEDFKKYKIDKTNVKIIDCISKTLIKAKVMPNTFYIPSPNALKELTILLNNEITENNIVILDSLPLLGVYHKDNEIIKFINLVKNIIEVNKKGKLVIITPNVQEKTILVKRVENILDHKMAFR